LYLIAFDGGESTDSDFPFRDGVVLGEGDFGGGITDLDEELEGGLIDEVIGEVMVGSLGSAIVELFHDLGVEVIHEEGVGLAHEWRLRSDFTVA
jgi:hypothetical protein